MEPIQKQSNTQTGRINDPSRAINQARNSNFHLGDLTLHPDEYLVERCGKVIRLRKKEYQLLEFLARNKNKIMNRNTLLEYVWNYNVQIMTNTLEVHISNLRRKIDGDYATKMLQTVYGLGYKLCDSPGQTVGYRSSGPT